MYKRNVTVFTPTYNRGYIIENLYKSLKKQTIFDFEWLVIDDGSNDETEDLFKKWTKDNNDFSIRYIKKENGGKHRAINRGVELAEGELFFIVDSDDYIVENAIELIIKWNNSIKNSEEKFAGIAGLKGYTNDTIVGSTFDGVYLDATSIERKKYNILGDKAEVFYTDILKKFKFPEIENEKFISENIVWDKIAFNGYKIRWFNEIIYICNYLNDGLTKSGQKLFLDNPKGYALIINKNIEYYNKSFKEKIYSYFNYYIQLRDKLTIREISENLQINILFLQGIIIMWKIKSVIKRMIR